MNPVRVSVSRAEKNTQIKLTCTFVSIKMTFLLSPNQQNKNKNEINQTMNFRLSWQHWMRGSCRESVGENLPKINNVVCSFATKVLTLLHLENITTNTYPAVTQTHRRETFQSKHTDELTDTKTKTHLLKSFTFLLLLVDW